MLYFTEGHGENLYKIMKKDEGLQTLGLDLAADDAEYRARLDAARKQLATENKVKEKAAKQKETSGRSGGGGGSGRGRGRGRSNSHHGGWHDHQSNYGRGRGSYTSYGGSQQPSGSGSWHQAGGVNPYYAPHAQYPAPWAQQNRKN